MKAEIITCEVSDGVRGWAHGWNQAIQRIVVPEANNLAITIDDKQLYICDEFKMDESCVKVGDVEIPDALVQKAVDWMKQKAELALQFKGFFKEEAKT